MRYFNGKGIQLKYWLTVAVSSADWLRKLDWPQISFLELPATVRYILQQETACNVNPENRLEKVPHSPRSSQLLYFFPSREVLKYLLQGEVDSLVQEHRPARTALPVEPA